MSVSDHSMEESTVQGPHSSDSHITIKIESTVNVNDKSTMMDQHFSFISGTTVRDRHYSLGESDFSFV